MGEGVGLVGEFALEVGAPCVGVGFDLLGGAVCGGGDEGGGGLGWERGVVAPGLVVGGEDGVEGFRSVAG